MGRGGAAAASAAVSFPDEVWEHVFSFLPTDADRNAAAATCRSWLHVERRCRRRLFVGNCYAVSPAAAVAKFPEVRAVAVKGKPHFADFNLVPPDWGAAALHWVAAMVEGWPQLEELRLKRMVVSDECLELIARSFRNFRVLALVSCEGFSTSGLAAIAAHCRNLRELDLQENEVEDNFGHWLSLFPESFTCLVTLNLACLVGEVNIAVLERLISRCPNLKSLKLNRTVPLDKLPLLLRRAPQLTDLGTGKFTSDFNPELFSKLEATFSACKKLRTLSGIWDVMPSYLPVIYPICEGLTFLNLSYSSIQTLDLIKIVGRCKNLCRLWVLDFIEDNGLAVVASSCKLLQELRVFPSDLYGAAPVALTERGLVAVSEGCPMLHSVLYFCRQMTNEALFSVARNRPNLTCFRLAIMEPHTPDYVTQAPLDSGFGAIVQSCKGLKRFSMSGLLTDSVFKFIGSSADRLEMLSVAFAGNSDAGLHYILAGCKSLKKLEIRDCPFSSKPLLAHASKLETMRSLWMSSCNLTLGECRQLAQKLPWVNVEVMDERVVSSLDGWLDNRLIEKLYIYRTLAGRRSDIPPCVHIV